MHMTPTRFVRIEGVNVVATVNTAEEAKTAVKELRHKKKELAHLKRGLLRQRKAAEAAANRARKARRSGQEPSFLDRMRSAYTTLRRLSGRHVDAGAHTDVPSIERECQRMDELSHNIDSAILQLQGKLIHHSVRPSGHGLPHVAIHATTLARALPTDLCEDPRRGGHR